jgi:hypothetical protein
MNRSARRCRAASRVPSTWRRIYLANYAPDRYWYAMTMKPYRTPWVDAIRSLGEEVSGWDEGRQWPLILGLGEYLYEPFRRVASERGIGNTEIYRKILDRCRTSLTAPYQTQTLDLELEQVIPNLEAAVCASDGLTLELATPLWSIGDLLAGGGRTTLLWSRVLAAPLTSATSAVTLHLDAGETLQERMRVDAHPRIARTLAELHHLVDIARGGGDPATSARGNNLLDELDIRDPSEM